VARSKADLAREEAVFESRRLQIRNEVWSAAAELERAWSAIAANETSVRASEESLRVVRERYEAGLSIAANETSVRASEESLRVVRERYEAGAALISDLLDTQTTLARAESSLAESRWSYLAARAAFAHATGSNG
jgi:outer membrane protein TolC